jgi:ketol-acid reductoisomerase
MARSWKDGDVNLDLIKNQTISVIGYGIQGNAQANNLKDSGLEVIVGLQEEGSSWKKAQGDGHQVMSIPKACEKADVIHILIPDMVQAQVYKGQIGPYLKPGKSLSFSHAAAIHWGWIKAPEFVDVIMVAPKGPGSKVRETYQQGLEQCLAVLGACRN